MAEQDQNRNEAATPHKLQEARKRGSVPKSLDVNSLVVLASAVAALYFWGHHIANNELLLASGIFSNMHQITFEPHELAGYLVQLIAETLIALAPLFLLLMVLSVLANFFQIGPVFSFFALKPDFDRVNPVAGFKRIFSMKLLMESVKTVLKFLLLGAVLYFAITDSIPKLIMTFQVNPASIGLVLFPLLVGMLFKLLLALTAIALLDLMYSRWDFTKRLRMSRREVTDEHKRREGDPRIKSRLRELQREAVKRAKSLGRIKDADVLITNPTHFAVAIKYDRQEMDAPVLIAKGAGFLAGRMRAIARRHRVPIIENRLLARHLFHHVQIEHPVPAKHYDILARILLWAFTLRGVAARSRTTKR